MGNAAAKFHWENISKIYVPSPLSDVVPPGESRKVTVKFTPPGSRVDEETLTMKILDGADEELRCIGTVTEAKCHFMDKILNFGNTHVGIRTKEQTITLRNTAKTPAVFMIENDDEEIEIKKKYGRILPESKYVISVSFYSPVPKNYESEIVVNIRGGKQQRLPVRAQSIVPEIFIEERTIDFGGVTFGDQKVLPLTIINNSDITAKLELDIRDYKEFEIILPDPNPDDDIHSEIMVPIHESPKYDDIEKMIQDDIDPLEGE